MVKRTVKKIIHDNVIMKNYVSIDGMVREGFSEEVTFEQIVECKRLEHDQRYS